MYPRILIRVALAGVAISLTGCAGAPSKPPEGSVRYEGKVVDRMDQSGKPNWAVNEGYSIYMFGAAGVALAHLSGEHGYVVYTIEEANGNRYQVAGPDDFPIGTCVEFWAVRERADQTHWMYGKAYMAAKECR